MVAAGNDSLFGKLAAAVGQPHWADDARFRTNDARVRNRTALIGELETIFRQTRAAEWARRLDAAGVPNAPIQSIDEVVAHPQTQALGILQQAPGLDMQLVGLPLRFDGQRPPFRRVAPELGEHNDALRAARPVTAS
jgi:crotonobetainyl-CoA:carnitine CoA-transferase CaiB-like acyl-CoA transferase